MKRLVTLFVLIGMIAVAAKAEAESFLRLPGSGKIFSKIPAKSMCLPKTCDMLGKDCGTTDDGCGGTLTCGSCSGFETCGGNGTSNVCGEACYRFAYTAEHRGGFENVFGGGNCLAEPENLTGAAVAIQFDHLTAGRGAPNLAFTETLPESSGDDSVMNLMNPLQGSWNIFSGETYRYSPQAVSWDGSGRMAVFSEEEDGAYALRVNDGPYYAGGEARLIRRFGRVPAQDIEWVPAPGGTRSRYLIVNFGNIPTALSLYVIDTEDADGQPIPLEEATPEERRTRAMLGAQPALDDGGAKMYFVRRGRILGCDLDFSRLTDAFPRAFCTNAQEPARLRPIEGEMASPAVSVDGRWLYLSMRSSGSGSWDLYRSRFDRQFLQPLTTTPGIDEKEIAALPVWMELQAQTAVHEASTIREEETEYQAVTTYQATYQTVAP